MFKKMILLAREEIVTRSDRVNFMDTIVTVSRYGVNKISKLVRDKCSNMFPSPHLH